MGTIKIGQREHNMRISDTKTGLLAEAHNRANEQAQANRRRRSNVRPATGSVRLSNTDSLGRANRIRQRLRAKIGEIMSSNVDEGTKKALARNVQMQLDRVENTVRQIRRRERAQAEERRERTRQEKRSDDERIERKREIRREQARRRRRSDIRERTIRVRRDFLTPANQGGFDPYDFVTNGINGAGSGTTDVIAGGPAVAFSIGGQSGVVMDAAPPAVDIVNMTI